jgi:hypothetical protein
MHNCLPLNEKTSWKKLKDARKDDIRSLFKWMDNKIITAEQ